MRIRRRRRPVPEERCFAPHCDPRVLHAPGECEHCDVYPDWQALRRQWGIAFTGHSAELTKAGAELPCPADFNRPPGASNQHRSWGKNQP